MHLLLIPVAILVVVLLARVARRDEHGHTVAAGWATFWALLIGALWLVPVVNIFMYGIVGGLLMLIEGSGIVGDLGRDATGFFEPNVWGYVFSSALVWVMAYLMVLFDKPLETYFTRSRRQPDQP